jgi:hypothetical protein
VAGMPATPAGAAPSPTGTGPSIAPGAVRLAQVAPGIHELELGQTAGSAAIITVRRTDNAGGVVQLSLPDVAPAEFERLGVDRPRLEEIVRAGGGRILESPEAVASVAQQIAIRGYVPIGIYLIGSAAAVVLLAVGLRLAGRA